MPYDTSVLTGRRQNRTTQSGHALQMAAPFLFIKVLSFLIDTASMTGLWRNCIKITVPHPNNRLRVRAMRIEMPKLFVTQWYTNLFVCRCACVINDNQYERKLNYKYLQWFKRHGMIFKTHWGRYKMAVIFQTTFWNGFSWMKIYEFHLRSHWSLFPRFESIIFQHWFR